VLGVDCEASGAHSAALGGPNAVASGAGAGAFATGNISGGSVVVSGDGAVKVGGRYTAVGATTVSGENSVSVGRTDDVTGTNGVAIGTSASASGDNGVSLGGGANSEGSAEVAVGFQAGPSGAPSRENAISIGSGAGNVPTPGPAVNRFNSIAIGSGAGGTLDEGAASISIGVAAQGSNANAIAIGSNPRAEGEDEIAIGRDAGMIGAEDPALREFAISIGYRAGNRGLASPTLDQTNAIAIGQFTGGQVSCPDGVAIGSFSRSNGESSVAIGRSANAGIRGIAIGKSASSGQEAITIGDSSAAGIGGISIGDAAQCSAYSISIGKDSFVTPAASACVISPGEGRTQVNAQGIVFIRAGGVLLADDAVIDPLATPADSLNLWGAGGINFYSEQTKTSSLAPVSNPAGMTIAAGASLITGISKRAAKEEIEVVDPAGAFARVGEVPAVTFRYIGGKSLNHGVIADDLYAVLPPLFTKGDPESGGRFYDDQVAGISVATLALAAVQGAKLRVEELEAIVDAQAAAIDALQATVDAQAAALADLAARVAAVESA
jgi:hypothetical protein